MSDYFSEIDDSENDDDAAEESSHSGGHVFIPSDGLVATVAAVQTVMDIANNGSAAYLERVNPETTVDQNIVAVTQVEESESLADILATMGYTIENIGKSEESALGDPLEHSEEQSENAEIDVVTNNQAIASGDNPDGNKTDGDGDGGDDPMSGQMSLFDDIPDVPSDNSHTTDNNFDNSDGANGGNNSGGDDDDGDDPMSGQMSLFDDTSDNPADNSNNTGDAYDGGDANGDTNGDDDGGDANGDTNGDNDGGDANGDDGSGDASSDADADDGSRD